jgi:ATP-dependent RNA circularization protein (DNA/RNA ligase family)
MIIYPKIESLYDRDEKTHKFIIGQFRLPEFRYLYPLIWRWTEKIDGTNIRVEWTGAEVKIAGRTDKAQIPPFLLDRLHELFPPERFKQFDSPLCLFGEGFGAKIQKGGGDYLPGGGCDFVLFDVLIGEWWLLPEDIKDMAEKLNIFLVPDWGYGTLAEAEKQVANGLHSAFGTARAEGLVCTPVEFLRTRRGDRIIVKLKTKDFA